MSNNELYGKDIIKFNFEFKKNEFSKVSSKVKIDTKKTNVSPAAGCDIIIHGSSTNTSRIYSLNKDLVINETSLTSFVSTSMPYVSLFGYCDADQLDDIFEQFKKRSIELLKEYSQQLKLVVKNIENL